MTPELFYLFPHIPAPAPLYATPLQREQTRVLGGPEPVIQEHHHEMVTVPDITGKKTEEARKILEDLGFEVKVSSPLGDLLHTVRFQDPKGGQQVRLRGEDGKKTVITLTVI